MVEIGLNIGDLAPEVCLTDQNGALVKLSSLIEDGPVSLVFFPLAFSGICSGELCALRENLAMFSDAGARVVAVSVDSKHTLRAWSESENYSFTILSDFWPHGDVASQYGIFNSETGFANRATFVINSTGRIVDKFVSPPGEPRPLSRYREALKILST